MLLGIISGKEGQVRPSNVKSSQTRPNQVSLGAESICVWNKLGIVHAVISSITPGHIRSGQIKAD